MNRSIVNVAAGLCLAAHITIPAPAARAADPPTPNETPLPSPVFSLADLDRTADPSKDFNQYVNGGWMKANPIPDEYSRWGSFSILGKRNQQIVRGILESAAHNVAPGFIGGRVDLSPEMIKIGNFYATAMDETKIHAEGIEPLQPELDRIAAIKDHAGLLEAVAHLQSIGAGTMFGFGQMQDMMDSTQVIGSARQGGLGLPDRDYYLKTDDKAKAIREAYVAHVEALLKLLGDDAAKAKDSAAKIMKLETILAQASMSRIDQRNPHNIYHPMDRKALAELNPTLNWPQYFKLVGVPDLDHINIGQPEFFKELDKQLKGVAIDDWKIYLRAHLIDAMAPYLSEPYVNEDFKFAQVMSGAKKLQPRWQRVGAATDRALGFAVGKIFVQQNFPPESKAAVTEILHNIKAALKDDIEHLEWMSPATRTQALAKLALIEEKIGYPDQWRDYSKLEIKTDSYVQNVMRANAFERDRQIAKIGKPVDRTEWGMTPQTVNAYYNPSLNEIVFPAGILMPPFFDPSAPIAINYGAIGVVIGHEITHGFDDQGAQYDGHGNLKNWWTEEDLKKFKAATNAVSDLFGTYSVAGGDTPVQGKLVTGEAVADLGGTKLAWRAYKAKSDKLGSELSDMQKNTSLGSAALTTAKGSGAETVADLAKVAKFPGFTSDQLFFFGFGHVWATNIRDEEARRLANTDTHPPAEFRVKGTLVNIPEFQKAFQIPDNSPMVNPNRAVIW